MDCVNNSVIDLSLPSIESTQSPTKSFNSSFTNCPLCFQSVPILNINNHIDSGCPSSVNSSSFQQSTLQLGRSNTDSLTVFLSQASTKVEGKKSFGSSKKRKKKDSIINNPKTCKKIHTKIKPRLSLTLSNPFPLSNPSNCSSSSNLSNENKISDESDQKHNSSNLHPVSCPICNKILQLSEINHHIDICIDKNENISKIEGNINENNIDYDMKYISQDDIILENNSKKEKNVELSHCPNHNFTSINKNNSSESPKLPFPLSSYSSTVVSSPPIPPTRINSSSLKDLSKGSKLLSSSLPPIIPSETSTITTKDTSENDSIYPLFLPKNCLSENTHSKKLSIYKNEQFFLFELIHHDNNKWSWHISQQNEKNFDSSSYAFLKTVNVRNISIQEVKIAMKSPLLDFDCLANFNSLAIESNRPVPRLFDLSVATLKSLLQKNIRLCRAENTVRIAVELIKKDGLCNFIRRLTVIILEDGFLHPCFPLLIWLMMALSKGLSSTFGFVDICLTIAYELAKCYIKDEFNPKEITDYHLDDNILLSDSRIDEIPTFEQTFVRSLILRSAYGGSSGDVKMIKKFSNLWLHRWLDQNNIDTPNNSISPYYLLHTSIGIYISASLIILALSSPWLFNIFQIYEQAYSPSPISLEKVRYIQDDDLVLSAIDQHCSNVVNHIVKLLNSDPKLKNILATLQSMGNDIQKHIAQIIWIYRSSKTTKQYLALPVDSLYSTPHIKGQEFDSFFISLEIYQQILPLLDQFSFNYYCSIISNNDS